MKLLTITALLVITGFNLFAQQAAPTLSPQDSATVYVYWKKANKVRLFSQERQLYLDSALAIMPWNAYFWQQKAMPLSKQMKHELAQPYLDSAVKYNPQKYTDYRGYMNCIFRKNYRDALSDFYTAKVLNGNSGVMDHPYNFYIGLCHLQLNNFDSAKLYIQKCIDEKTAQHGVDWTHPLHWFYLSVAYQELGDIEQAIKHINTTIKMNPTMPDAWYVKGGYLSEKKMYGEAYTASVRADSLRKQRYSIGEDGDRYEHFPYSLNQFYLDGRISWLEKMEDNDNKK